MIPINYQLEYVPCLCQDFIYLFIFNKEEVFIERKRNQGQIEAKQISYKIVKICLWLLVICYNINEFSYHLPQGITQHMYSKHSYLVHQNFSILLNQFNNILHHILYFAMHYIKIIFFWQKCKTDPLTFSFCNFSPLTFSFVISVL